MTITWNEASVPISKLKEYKHNPRKLTKKDYEKLIRSLKEDGYHQRIIINKDHTILGGHQRKKAMTEVFGKDYIVTVLMPNRELTQEEIDRINIRDNLPYGSFDFDILSGRFDLEKLSEFGMDENMIIGFDFGGENNDGGKPEGKDEKESKCTCDCCKH